MVPAVPVAGASPAKRPSAYPGHWPSAYPGHWPSACCRLTGEETVCYNHRVMLGRSKCCFAIVLCLWTLLSAEGASLPFAGLDDLRGPYEGTGVSGEALHVQPLGDAGGWPICAYWSSARTERSPLLGFGWSVPALESRFVPLDERRWGFYQPDGYLRIFVRATPGDDSVLTGGSAWAAVCKGDAIRVTADPHDGGPKSEFHFRQGRLVRMSCEEGDFEIKYTGRSADRIVSRGKTLLEVTRETSPEDRVTFRFNGGRSRVVATCRPAVAFGVQGASSAWRRRRRGAWRHCRQLTVSCSSHTAASEDRRSSRSARRAGCGIRARERSSPAGIGPTR